MAEDKVKSNIQYRNKVILGAVFFMLLMVLGIMVVLVWDKKTNQLQEPVQEPVALAVVPSDTISIVPKKSVAYRYKDMDNFQSQDEIQIFKDESIVGKTEEEIQQKEKEQEDEISEYIKNRRQKWKSSESENSVEPQRISHTDKKEKQSSARTYSREKIIQQEQEVENIIDSYQTAREKEQSKQVKKISSQKRNSPQSFEDLTAVEKRRILLETGLSEYSESQEISAMIISSGEVRSGQTITLQLKEDAYLKFKKIPKGTTISGVVSFSENRMQVNFSTIRIKRKIIKVNLTLYGLDGLVGLPLGNDVLQKDMRDVGYEEANSEDITGTRAERIIKKVGRLIKTKKEVKVDLGRDIMCILVNNDIN